MVAEGVIALIWAAAGCALYKVTGGLNTGLSEVLANGQSAAIYDVCIKTMGGIGVALAMIGVIVCPITSGDTAFRSARLVLADWFKIDQNKLQKRLILCVPLLAVGAFVGHLDYAIGLDRTYQLNVGGNTDFLNMLERDRLESKKISKTDAVTSQITGGLKPKNVHIGPSDYIEWLDDRKWCYIRMEGTTFGDVTLNFEGKLEVHDSPNSAGVIIDAVRCAKLALENSLSGAITAPSSYFFKSPPEQYYDDECRRKTEAFIEQYGKK